MASSTLFFLVFVISFLPFTPTMSQTLEEEFPQVACGAFDSSNPDSINDILSSISSTSINSGFLYNSSNQNSNYIELVGLCRGDLQEDGCRSCLNDSASRIRQSCPSKSEAILWSLNCTLRYASQKIYGVMDVSDSVSFRSSSGVATCSNETLYEQEFLDLLSSLQTKAAAGSVRKMAVGNLSTDSDTSYVLVQCTPDLSEQLCKFCLNNIYQKNISSSCDKTRQVIFNPSCNYRRDDHNFLDMSSPQSIAALTPETAPLPPISPGNGSFPWRKKLIIVAALLGFSLLVLVYIVIGKQKYTLRKIRAATKDFSEENKLGEGGCGTVFKGLLPNGEFIAVKRLTSWEPSEKVRLTFKNEATLLAKLEHENMVKLLGFCEKGEEKILVYEYMPKSSLDCYIFDEKQRQSLVWDTRYKIIQGIAEGLSYLHQRLRDHGCIIHRDLKAQNILLDEDMKPKIADFGIAKPFITNATHITATFAVGTPGYMAPEYCQRKALSKETDVYSFGVLMLEIVSGRSVNDKGNLINDAWKSFKEGNASNFKDSNLSSTFTKEISTCIHIALLCVGPQKNDRPSMEKIVEYLRNRSAPQNDPPEPAQQAQ